MLNEKNNIAWRLPVPDRWAFKINPTGSVVQILVWLYQAILFPVAYAKCFSLLNGLSNRGNGHDGKYIQDERNEQEIDSVCDETERSTKCLFFVKNKGNYLEFHLNE